MKIDKINFPLDSFDKLIENISGFRLDEWIYFLEKDKDLLSEVNQFYGHNFCNDWLWGVVLPIFTNVINLKQSFAGKKVIGLSALPGTGKSTLGRLIEGLSLRKNVKVSVVSMDDFYLPFNEMKIAIKNNPWNVSRGFPGSHSINLMEEKILEWKDTGVFNYPVFDKALRNGLGDRTSWNTSFPEIIILEGWFLGVKPYSDKESEDNKELILSNKEIIYRSKIQSNLEKYLKIWNLIDKIWQISPSNFLYMNQWKSNQEKEMLERKGSALVKNQLTNFIRMLNCSIPQKSFSNINSNYKIILNKNREVTWVGLNT